MIQRGDYPKLLAAAALLIGLGASPALRAEGGGSEAAAGGEYVGSEACINCHEHQDFADELRATMHGKVNKSNWAGGSGCESCHGPGAAHAKSKGKGAGMINPNDLKPHEQSALCMKCHDGGDRQYWQGGAHDGRGLSCLSCHQIHPKGGVVNEHLLVQEDTFKTCTNSCHLQKKTVMTRSSHMPIREGSMTCTSCHNPHGSLGPAQLKQLSVNENCYACHAEKRSPNLWEHPPVKENCLNCHDPHGTMHPNLLKARMPRLCQQCHDESRHPSTPYASSQTDEFFPSQRLVGHGCANCHPNVHGSNHPSGSRFMR